RRPRPLPRRRRAREGARPPRPDDRGRGRPRRARDLEDLRPRMRLVATIAGRSLLQRPARTLFSALGVALGIAISVGVFTLDHNTVLGLSPPGLPDGKPELDVRPAPGLAHPRDDLAATPGVAGVSAFLQDDVAVRRDPADGVRPLGRVVEGGGAVVQARLFALEAS